MHNLNYENELINCHFRLDGPLYDEFTAFVYVYRTTTYK